MKKRRLSTESDQIGYSASIYNPTSIREHLLNHSTACHQHQVFPHQFHKERVCHPPFQWINKFSWLYSWYMLLLQVALNFLIIAGGGILPTSAEER